MTGGATGAPPRSEGDRQTGRCIATSAWRYLDDMRDSAEAAGRLRTRAGERFGGPASAVLPQIEHLPGFRSASLLVEPASGRAVSSVSFGSREAMEQNRDYASTLKAESMRAAGASAVDEGEFELVIAHLRVPELV